MICNMEKCKGTPILSAQVVTPLGLLTLRSCTQGYHSISFPDSTSNGSSISDKSIINDSRTTAEPVHLIRPIDAATESSIIVAAKMKLDNQLDWVKKYFKDPMSCGNVIKFTDFCFEGGTDFEIKVWKTLFENVKVGETISYANLAAAIDNPRAARAVGTALKKNPIPLMIPCHRVIKSDGKLGSFSGGRRNQCKEYLNQHEKMGITP